MNEECFAHNIFFFHQHHLAVNGEVEQKKEKIFHINIAFQHFSTIITTNMKNDLSQMEEKSSFDAFCIRKPILPRFASYFNILANVSSHQQ